MSFKINTESIKPKSKGKSSLCFRRHRGYTLRKVSNKDGRNVHEIHNNSSVRCPKFITFNQLETVRNDAVLSEKSDKKGIIVSEHSKYNVPHLKNLMVHRANSPMTIVRSVRDLTEKNAAVLNSETTGIATNANLSILSLPGRSNRTIGKTSLSHIHTGSSFFRQLLNQI